MLTAWPLTLGLLVEDRHEVALYLHVAIPVCPHRVTGGTIRRIGKHLQPVGVDDRTHSLFLCKLSGTVTHACILGDERGNGGLFGRIEEVTKLLYEGESVTAKFILALPDDPATLSGKLERRSCSGGSVSTLTNAIVSTMQYPACKKGPANREKFSFKKKNSSRALR